MGHIIHKGRDLPTGVSFRPFDFYDICTQVGKQLCTVSTPAVGQVQDAVYTQGALFFLCQSSTSLTERLSTPEMFEPRHDPFNR